MMKHTLLAAALLAGSAAFGGMALAQQTVAPAQTAPAAAQQTADTSILSLGEVVNRLSQQGYRDIHDIELDDGVYEVEARAAEGHKIELHVDPRSGGIISTERDDH